MSPPCCSFSPLRNLDAGGPLRPIGCPQGDASNAAVKLGNDLWFRALLLASIMLAAGTYIIMEHPKNSKAWLLPETIAFQKRWGLVFLEFDACMFWDEGSPRTQKPTRLLTNAPWLIQLFQRLSADGSTTIRCDGMHQHDAPLRGARAKAAAAYSHSFCSCCASALEEADV